MSKIHQRTIFMDSCFRRNDKAFQFYVIPRRIKYGINSSRNPEGAELELKSAGGIFDKVLLQKTLSPSRTQGPTLIYTDLWILVFQTKKSWFVIRKRCYLRGCSCLSILPAIFGLPSAYFDTPAPLKIPISSNEPHRTMNRSAIPL